MSVCPDPPEKPMLNKQALNLSGLRKTEEPLPGPGHPRLTLPTPRDCEVVDLRVLSALSL